MFELNHIPARILNLQILRAQTTNRLHQLSLELIVELKMREKGIKRQHKKNKSGILITDFIEEYKIKGRLRVVLFYMVYHAEYFYIDDFQLKDLMHAERMGQKNLEQFTNIICNKMNGSRFESKQEMLKKHFNL